MIGWDKEALLSPRLALSFPKRLLMTNKINVVPLSPDRSPASDRWLFQLVAEVHAGQCTLELLAIWTLMETGQTTGQTWGHRRLPVDCALIAVGNTSWYRNRLFVKPCSRRVAKTHVPWEKRRGGTLWSVCVLMKYNSEPICLSETLPGRLCCYLQNWKSDNQHV